MRSRVRDAAAFFRLDSTTGAGGGIATSPSVPVGRSFRRPQCTAACPDSRQRQWWKGYYSSLISRLGYLLLLMETIDVTRLTPVVDGARQL